LSAVRDGHAPRFAKSGRCGVPVAGQHPILAAQNVGAVLRVLRYLCPIRKDDGRDHGELRMSGVRFQSVEKQQDRRFGVLVQGQSKVAGISRRPPDFLGLARAILLRQRRRERDEDVDGEEREGGERDAEEKYPRRQSDERRADGGGLAEPVRLIKKIDSFKNLLTT